MSLWNVELLMSDYEKALFAFYIDLIQCIVWIVKVQLGSAPAEDRCKSCNALFVLAWPMKILPRETAAGLSVLTSASLSSRFDCSEVGAVSILIFCVFLRSAWFD